MPWYSMPKLYQKDIAHMMNRLQNGAVLTMGPFADLNYETASNVRISTSNNPFYRLISILCYSSQKSSIILLCYCTALLDRRSMENAGNH